MDTSAREGVPVIGRTKHASANVRDGRIDQNLRKTLMKLNLGCGSRVVDGWINVDYALGARLMKAPLFTAINRRIRLFETTWDRRIFIHDLRKKFPWADGSADAVYSSHTLEHLSREDGRRFLRECFRVLKPQGLLRIVVPDLSVIISQYNDGKLNADDLLDRLEVLSDGSGGFLKRLLSPYISYPHRCMYDAKRLVAVMREVGFGAASRQPFDSGIGDIRSIELADRTIDAVIVEGQKP